MNIDYEHSKNIHSLSGPQSALKIIFGDKVFASLLDVGCGTGTWLKAAKELGIPDIYGVDGVDIPKEQLHVPTEYFQKQNLTQHWALGRRFDVVLCFEVAEHLDTIYAPVLIDALVRHSDLTFFSAACPGQSGQNHVNCQWPVYWQDLFNQRGFVCSDDPRWRIWEDDRIEPWYRQNLFVACHDPKSAGKEERIKSVLHPDMSPFMVSRAKIQVDSYVLQVEQGRMPASWYFRMLMLALKAKLKRYFT